MHRVTVIAAVLAVVLVLAAVAVAWFGSRLAGHAPLHPPSLQVALVLLAGAVVCGAIAATLYIVKALS